MKVKQFEAKYKSIQERAKDINGRIAPILKELKKLGREASSLAYRADLDKNLYKVDERDGTFIEDGWNIAILHKLACMNLSEEVSDISDALYEVIHTPFIKPKKKDKGI